MLVLQISRLLDCMDPVKSDYRIDLLTRSYPDLKAAMLQAGSAPAAQGTAQGQGRTEDSSSPALSWGGPVVVDTEPWFSMEAAWAPVDCVSAAAPNQ
jgi:hypothetical protein